MVQEPLRQPPGVGAGGRAEQRVARAAVARRLRARATAASQAAQTTFPVSTLQHFLHTLSLVAVFDS